MDIKHTAVWFLCTENLSEQQWFDEQGEAFVVDISVILLFYFRRWNTSFYSLKILVAEF